MNALDVVLALVLLAYAAIGFRQGLLTSALGAVGFLGGGWLALWLLPVVLARLPQLTTSGWRTALISVIVVFLLALAGQTLGSVLGQHLRSRTPGGLRVVDSLLGVVASVAAAAVVLWLAAGLVRPAAPSSLATAISSSRVLATIDAVLPSQTTQVLAGVRALIDRSGFPQVFGGLSAEPIIPVPVPDPTVADTPGLQAARASIVKVSGDALACQRGQEGSGWVVRPGQVVTNAHVVAGLTEVHLQPGGIGRSYVGRVVLFDPEVDLAIVDAPDLPTAPLALGQPLSRGDSAVVTGFPLNGPYHEVSARVRGQLTAVGSDIYGRPGSSREIYSLYAQVEPGNSGGPLLDPRGHVVGVTFAKSIDDANTGYALTLAEVRTDLNLAATLRSPVSTGTCQVS